MLDKSDLGYFMMTSVFFWFLIFRCGLHFNQNLWKVNYMQCHYVDIHWNKLHECNLELMWKTKMCRGREARERTDLLCLDIIHLHTCFRLHPCLPDALFPFIARNHQHHPLRLSMWPLNYSVWSTGLQVSEVAPQTWNDWREKKFFRYWRISVSFHLAAHCSS